MTGELLEIVWRQFVRKEEKVNLKYTSNPLSHLKEVTSKLLIH